MKKNLLFGLLTILVAGFGFGGISMASYVASTDSDNDCTTSFDGCYESLDAAVAAAQDGDTITLLADLTISTKIDIVKDLTIEVNGHTVNAEGATNLILQITNDKTLTIDGTVEGSTVYGRINVGVATNNNGNVVLNGGTYSVGAGQTVLHINGTCLDSDVTINNATILSANDNGIQLNGSGTFVIDNSTIIGGTAVYIKSGKLTLTNSTLKGTLDPVNYSYYGNGANPTGDGIVVDSCEYPGGEPTLDIGDGNTIEGTKKEIGYYRYDANNDSVFPNAVISSLSNDFSLPDGYAWFKEGNAYTIVEGYSITLGTVSNGTITSDLQVANEGDTVTLTATPATNYNFSSWTVKATDETNISVENNKFTMPAKNVTVTATFNAKSTSVGGSGGRSTGGSSSSNKEETKAKTGDVNTGATEEINLGGEVTDEANANDGKTPDTSKPAVIISDRAKNNYKPEQIEAYIWAYENGITTINDIEKARLSDSLTRAELAKMMSQYISSVLKKSPIKADLPGYRDVNESLGDLADYIVKAYQYQIMGIDADGNALEYFYPNNKVTRAEYGTVFSRVLYGLVNNQKDGPYYEKHLAALKEAGILTNDDPTMEEVRGWVMIMMYRSVNPQTPAEETDNQEPAGTNTGSVAEVTTGATAEAVTGNVAEATTGAIVEAEAATTGAVAEVTTGAVAADAANDTTGAVAEATTGSTAEVATGTVNE